MDKNKKINSLLIIEKKETHWTTVEPILKLAINRSIDFQIYCTSKSRDTLINSFEKNIQIPKDKFIIDSFYGIIKLIISKRRDIIIFSDGFFKQKIKINSFQTWVKVFLWQVSHLIFLRLHIKKSFSIITTHVIESLNLKVPRSKIRGSNILNGLESYIFSFAIKNSDAVNVYSSLIQTELNKLVDKPVLLAPNAIFRGKVRNIKPLEKEKLKIVVSGRIDSRRRYYKWIETIHELVGEKFSIILLGRPFNTSDKAIIEKIDALGYPQEYSLSGKFISSEIFDKTIESCDFLFAPLIRLDNYYSSLDRNLGPFFDAIRYGKPIFIPSYCPIAPECSGNVVKYDNDLHLADLIRIYHKNSKLRADVSNNAIRNSRCFSIEKMNYLDNIETKIF